MTVISVQTLFESPVRADVPVSPWVQRFAHLLPSGQILDLACGGGRHTHWLLALGYAVMALDRNPEVLPALYARGANVMQHDLEPSIETTDWPFAESVFSGIIVCNYLHRPLFPHLLASLEPGGVLIYETFAQGNADFGKPSNPAFLLKHGELLQQMRSNPGVQMQVIAYEEGFVTSPKDAMVQRICARKAAFSSAFDHL
ncbi:class I SAM-dependent methyltransferase [Undibacterium sp. Ji67W]|uniref:class I SAM-dependent methyltransferase n=1 Tax=Undibacterium sp. Ji67W TaxID=3413042 RepID=UPI003BF044F0